MEVSIISIAFVAGLVRADAPDVKSATDPNAETSSSYE